MDHVTVITATRGIGLQLARQAIKLGMSTETYGIAAGSVGISNTLPAEKVDYLIDIECENDLDKIAFKPSNYLIWSTGAFLKIPLEKMTDAHINTLSALHYNVPLCLMRRFHEQQKSAYHLIVIASCSSWRLREQEAVYCGLNSAKATFTRNIAGDMAIARPGSKVTLFNPGGIRTPFYYEEAQEGAGFINQEWLAEYMWSSILNQTDVFSELQILREKPVKPASIPIIEYGQKIPEVYSNK